MSYLLNTDEILQTIRMIDQQHLDVRTITLGLSLLDCAGEDIDLVSASFARFDLGRIETVAGAAGGVRYRAIPSKEKVRKILNNLSEKLAEPGRMLPGGFLYTSDVSADSGIAQALGEILEGQLGIPSRRQVWHVDHRDEN